jgi:hypothetical protein
MSTEETQPYKVIVPGAWSPEALDRFTTLLKSDAYPDVEQGKEALMVVCEYEGKKYKGVLYPVEEQAQEPPIVRIDDKLISKGY